MSEPTISLLLMGKNEREYFLPAVIESAKEFVDEIVYIDTGSNDGTVEWLAETHPDVKVYHHEWVGWERSNAVRNFGIKKCTSEYILATDCDEVFGNDKSKIKPTLDKFRHIDVWDLEGRHYMYDLVNIDNSVPQHMWINRIFKNNGKLFYPENQHGLVQGFETKAGMIGDIIHHYGHCKNMALALRRYDENTGAKNEWEGPLKEKREEYLRWQLWTMVTGKYPRRRIQSLSEHPKEIQKMYHTELIEDYAKKQGLTWKESSSSITKKLP